MPANATDLTSAVPSIVPTDVPAMSDEECLARLAQAIKEHDAEHLDDAMLDRDIRSLYRTGLFEFIEIKREADRDFLPARGATRQQHVCEI